MGVKGLWRLLDGTGQPVSLESLEGKVLAIDISLWLNMAVKGMRDVHGHSANDAHLITLFNRICKLLYFGVKPIFVFDGKAPLIKQRTIQERQDRKHAHVEQKHSASQKLLQNYLKTKVLQTAIKKSGKSNTDDSASEHNDSSKATSIDEIRKAKKNEEEDLFALPPLNNEKALLNSSDDEREEQWIKRSSTRDAVYGSAMMGDFRQMMSIDVESEDFKTLPHDIQHELLNDIKEIRKRRRTQFETMPDNSKSFSDYQLAGLLAKREISDRIEKVEKQMQESNAVSMSELGYECDPHDSVTIKASQLISDENTRFILVNKLIKKSKVLTAEPDEKAASAEETSSANNTFDSYATTSSVSTLEDESDEENEIKVLPKSDDSSKSFVDHSTELSPDSNDNAIVKSKHEPEEKASLVIREEAKASNVSARISDDDVAASVPNHSALNLLNETDAAVAFANNSSKKSIAVEISPGSPNNQAVPNRQGISSNITVASSISAEVNRNIEVTKSTVAKSTFDSEAVESDEDFVDVTVDVITEADDNATQNVKEQEDKEASSEKSDAPSSDPNPWHGFEMENVNVVQEQIDAEDVALIEKMKSSARAARDLSDVATSESQQLLQLFGIPYVVSPQEAESQCAYLDACGLTMGTITDDSDVLLFGGRVVFKAVFDRKHDPFVYSASGIKAELGLERNHLINIALCSGSDYTIGIENAGPVAALEIMKEFPGDGIESLIKFKTWWDDAHQQVSEKTIRKTFLIIMHVTPAQLPGFIKQKLIKIPPAETKIKSRLRKLNVPDNFPSQFVVDAYLNPVVNESRESFSWGIPDLDAIRNFLMERLSWTKNKVDESLLPVLKRISERRNQKQILISSYFSKSSAAAPLVKVRKKKSKRVTRAIFGITQTAEPEENTKSKQKSRKRTRKFATKSATKRASTQNEAKLCLSESSSSDSL